MAKMNLVAFWSDGHDGGGGITLYNNLDELRKDCFTPDEWTPPEECQRRYDSALNGEDPYEDGEITNVVVDVEILPGGTLRLANSLHLHYGQ